MGIVVGGANKPAPKQVAKAPIKGPVAAKRPPANLGGDAVDGRDIAALLDKWNDDPAYGEKLPPLDALSLDIQGGPKSGKSALLVGNPHAVILKMPDGTPTAPHRLAKITPVNSLVEFEDKIADLLQLGRKYGQEGQWRMVGIDPTFKLTEWLQDREVMHVNLYGLKGDRQRRTEEEVARAQEASNDGQGSRPYDHISEIPNPAIWGKVADYFAKLIGSLQSVGFGVATCTHYKLKLQGDVKAGGRMEWLPDIQPTVASAIAKVTDILCVTRRISGKCWVEFGVDKPDAGAEYLAELSSRIPMEGSIELPDYAEDAQAVSWDLFAAEYEKVRTTWNKNVAAFRTAHS